MRVFVYEYVCGGGMAGRTLPESLAREGWAMLASVIEDFARVDGCDVVTTLDDRLLGRTLAARRVEPIDAERERRDIERLAADCDWTLVIAPEFGNILYDRVRWVEQAGGRSLGSASDAVMATADKLTCERRLRDAGVPTVSSQSVQFNQLPDGPIQVLFPCILKPRHGAGSQSTFLLSDARALHDALDVWRQESGTHDEALLQRFVPGTAASVSLLVGREQIVPLAAASQILSDDGRFRYLGGRVPIAAALADRATRLGLAAVRASSGLLGYVGVDLVLGDDASGDAVIEINPRLTTSYVGLRALARCNLAERMLSVVRGDPIGSFDWRPGPVGFSADGRII